MLFRPIRQAFVVELLKVAVTSISDNARMTPKLRQPVAPD